jgi:hypothetical protein
MISCVNASAKNHLYQAIRAFGSQKSRLSMPVKKSQNQALMQPVQQLVDVFSAKRTCNWAH